MSEGRIAGSFDEIECCEQSASRYGCPIRRVATRRQLCNRSELQRTHILNDENAPIGTISIDSRGGGRFGGFQGGHACAIIAEFALNNFYSKTFFNVLRMFGACLQSCRTHALRVISYACAGADSNVCTCCYAGSSRYCVIFPVTR